MVRPQVQMMAQNVFGWLGELKLRPRTDDRPLIDLGIGSPDRPTPSPILDVMRRAVTDQRHHGYPTPHGTAGFRASAARYLARRWHTRVDANAEVLSVSGAEEGFMHLALALCGPGTLTLVADVHYPIHSRAPAVAGGELAFVPICAERNFLPDLGRIPSAVLSRARMLIINYPHNPTGACAPPSFLADAVALCRAHDIVLVSDLAYGELRFDGQVAPSVLEVPGALDVAVEFHSMSKSFNMAGFRVAFAAGNAQVIAEIRALRSNCSYGVPSALEEAAAFALDHAESLVPGVVGVYRERRDAVVDGFRQLGWEVTEPLATMFVWLRVPAPFTSAQWVERLVTEASVVVTPGHAFGPGGEGWFRVSLVAETPVLREAIDRLRRLDLRWRD